MASHIGRKKKKDLKCQINLSLFNVLHFPCALSYIPPTEPFPYCVADMSQQQNARKLGLKRKDGDLEASFIA